MKNLKEKLIRLGHQDPSLRRHLTPILDEVSRSKKAFLDVVSKGTASIVHYGDPHGEGTITIEANDFSMEIHANPMEIGQNPGSFAVSMSGALSQRSNNTNVFLDVGRITVLDDEYMLTLEGVNQLSISRLMEGESVKAQYRLSVSTMDGHESIDDFPEGTRIYGSRHRGRRALRLTVEDVERAFAGWSHGRVQEYGTRQFIPGFSTWAYDSTAEVLRGVKRTSPDIVDDIVYMLNQDSKFKDESDHVLEQLAEEFLREYREELIEILEEDLQEQGHRAASYRDKSAMSTRETQLKNLDRGDIFMVEDWDTREWIRYKVDRKRGGAVDVIREDTRKKDRMDGEMKVLKVYE